MVPPLELPTIQNWSCHNCGGCCRQHEIEITPQERERILGQRWENDAELPQDRPTIEKIGPWPWTQRYRLGHQADGGCIFLDSKGLCRIHAKFGESAKPLACRIYPFAFHPAGKKIAVSLRFSCPSVTGNRGQSVASRRDELKGIEKLVVPENADQIPPPEISPGQRLDWNETMEVVSSLEDVVCGGGGVAMSVLRGLRFVSLLGQSKFDKIRGARLGDFLEIISAAATSDAEVDWPALAEPSPTARMQFRLLCAQYARRDTLADRGKGWRDRWRLFRAALRFTRGVGEVPPLQEGFAPVLFSALEQNFGALPAEAEELFLRYLRVKLQGVHFCGRAYYDAPLVEGFQSLALVIPATIWLARWLAVGAKRNRLSGDDVSRALNVADHHHGFSPAFGQAGFRGRVRWLAQLDEIAKLTAWYGRLR